MVEGISMCIGTVLIRIRTPYTYRDSLYGKDPYKYREYLYGPYTYRDPYPYTYKNAETRIAIGSRPRTKMYKEFDPYKEFNPYGEFNTAPFTGPIYAIPGPSPRHRAGCREGFPGLGIRDPGVPSPRPGHGRDIPG